MSVVEKSNPGPEAAELFDDAREAPKLMTKRSSPAVFAFAEAIEAATFDPIAPGSLVPPPVRRDADPREFEPGPARGGAGVGVGGAGGVARVSTDAEPCAVVGLSTVSSPRAVAVLRSVPAATSAGVMTTVAVHRTVAPTTTVAGGRGPGGDVQECVA